MTTLQQEEIEQGNIYHMSLRKSFIFLYANNL